MFRANIFFHIITKPLIHFKITFIKSGKTQHLNLQQFARKVFVA